MRLVKLIATWLLVASLGYAIGWWFVAGFDLQNTSSALKASAGLFGFAIAGIGIILKLSETPPPNDLDDCRREYWQRKFSARWRMLWVRWFLLATAGIVAVLAAFALDDKFTLLTHRHAVAAGTASILVGGLGILISMKEIFAIKKAVQDVQNTLQYNRKKQEILNRLQGPPPGSDKTAQA